MAIEGSYEYECMRAELLGIDRPDYDEFMKIKAEKAATEGVELTTECLKETHAQQEELHQVSGKLHELNSILKSTQKKINNLTAPFSRFVRAKIGMPASSNEQDTRTTNSENLEINPEEFKEPDRADSNDEAPNRDHVPLIDNLIDKFDRTQISMEVQNKQMKRFMK
uniref:Uncharacterized protein n=1 Tax=Dendroctonus ponderosae TaxID=77166 RepID=A0AAR5QIS7_DENPD